MPPRLPSAARIATAALTATTALAVLLSPRPSRARETDPLRLSTGEGVTVAVVGTDEALVATVRGRAPGCRAFLVVPAGETAGRRRMNVSERRAVEDDALARALDEVLGRGARVILIAVTCPDEGERTTEAIARALARGALVIAPAGDEGLSHERYPAATDGVLGVAAIASDGALAPETNAGSRTRVAARAATSSAASAAVAAASAVALGFDPTLTAAELGRALAAGETVARASPRGGCPARLDLGALLERVRPRSRAVALEDLRVSPGHVPRGEQARIRVRVVAVGRLPARGPLVASVEGLHDVEVPFGPLSPGEAVELEAPFVPRPLHEGVPLSTADGGLLVGSPLLATVRVPGASGPATRATTLDVVPPGEHPPALRIVAVAAGRALAVRVLLENPGAASEPAAAVRLVGEGGVLLAESAAPVLAPGERAWIALTGAVRRAPGDERLRVTVQAARRPKGFRETMEERWPLVLDPRGAPAPRKGSRR